MTWHVDSELVAGYVDDRLSPAQAASVESHLMGCADCRQLIAGSVAPQELANTWAAIADEIDQPHRGVIERLLTRVGVRDHLARLVVLTPSLRMPWLIAVGALLFLSAASTRDAFAGSNRSVFTFLVLAPLVPLAGVAAAFGRRTDPATELTTAAPISAFELLLVRSLGVLATTTALTAAAAVIVPNQGWTAAAWLLPALGLTATALALTRWVSAFVAATGLGGVWVLASSSVLRGNRGRVDLVDHFVAFRPAGQAAFLLLTCLAIAVVLYQRDRFDLRRIT